MGSNLSNSLLKLWKFGNSNLNLNRKGYKRMGNIMDKKIILITGCSSGFGYLGAIYLAEKGYQVVATMRNLTKRSSLDDEIKNRNLPIKIRQLDVTDPESIRQCIKEVEREYGRLDILVNNAGYGIGGFFEDLSDREYRDQMETNFFGVLNMVRGALPLLRKSNDARIINISSTAGLTTTPGMGAYNASKWAVEAFSESLRQELALHGIKVLLIEPGPYPTKVLTINTRFAERANDPQSPNYPFTQKLYVKYKQNNETLKSDPMEITRLMGKLISKKNPSFRNVRGPGAKFRAFMHRFLPWKFNEWVIRRVIFGKL